MTPLHLAIANGQRSVARLLIHSGADVSLPEKRGLTPLRLAVEMADKATVELLLMAKSPAELDIQDKVLVYNCLAFDHADPKIPSCIGS